MILTLALSAQFVAASHESREFTEKTKLCSYGLVKDSFTKDGIYTSFQGARCVFSSANPPAALKELHDYYEQRLIHDRKILSGPSEQTEPFLGVEYEVEVVRGAKNREGKRETLLGTFRVNFSTPRELELLVTSRSLSLRGTGPDSALRRLDLDFHFSEVSSSEEKGIELKFLTTVSVKKPWYAYVSDEEFTKMADETTRKNMKKSIERLEAELLQLLSD